MTIRKVNLYGHQRNASAILRNVAVLVGVFLAATVVLGSSGVSASEIGATTQKQTTVSIDLAFVTHLDMDLPEQDIYIEREPGSGKVYRVTKGDNDMNAPLYKAAQPIKHNPFSEEAIGPYAKGEALNMTLGQWLKHSGTGTYTCTDGEGALDTSFAGLVPDGVYTMWHAFIALPPTDPFSGTLDLPLGARDGSSSVFVADAQGKAAFRHTFRPCLQMSDVWTTSMLAINWHSDGKTYGAHPGEFGYNAHIPLFLMLPNRDDIN